LSLQSLRSIPTRLIFGIVIFFFNIKKKLVIIVSLNNSAIYCLILQFLPVLYRFYFLLFLPCKFE
jgi:hypothetical protein